MGIFLGVLGLALLIGLAWRFMQQVNDPQPVEGEPVDSSTNVSDGAEDARLAGTGSTDVSALTGEFSDASAAASSPDPALVDDWDTVGPKLSVQLYSGAYPATFGMPPHTDAVVTQRLNDVLSLILVCDQGIRGRTSERNIHSASVKQWGMTEEELFAKALRQAVVTFITSDNLHYEATATDGRKLAQFVSTSSGRVIAFVLGRESETPFLFGVPNWSNALIRDLDSEVDFEIVQWLATATRERCADSDAPGLPDIFVAHSGRYDRVEFDPSGEQVVGPEILVATLRDKSTRGA